MMLANVWPADVLVIAQAGEQAAIRWMPEPLRMWQCMNAVPTSPAMDGLMGIMGQDPMIDLPVPPLDAILPSALPTYDEAVTSNQLAIDLITDDEGDSSDNDDDGNDNDSVFY